jgi:hypothetical protein
MTRRLTIAACLLGTITLGIVAWWGGRVAAPVTSVVAVAAPATASAVGAAPAPTSAPAPTTTPPASTPPASTPPAASPVPNPASPATTVPPIPLGTFGERLSALPTPPVAAVAPRSVRIDTAGVRDRAVRPVGLEPSGELEVPDETEIGWYRLGSSPGNPGATVLAAHVSWNRSLGPFARLGAVEPGDPVEVTLQDGTVRRYRVVERAQYPKGTLPGERIWTRDGDETLVLITCGGGFNPQIRRYLDNIVVYAVPDPV